MRAVGFLVVDLDEPLAEPLPELLREPPLDEREELEREVAAVRPRPDDDPPLDEPDLRLLDPELRADELDPLPRLLDERPLEARRDELDPPLDPPRERLLDPLPLRDRSAWRLKRCERER